MTCSPYFDPRAAAADAKAKAARATSLRGESEGLRAGSVAELFATDAGEAQARANPFAAAPLLSSTFGARGGMGGARQGGSFGGSFGGPFGGSLGGSHGGMRRRLDGPNGDHTTDAVHATSRVTSHATSLDSWGMSLAAEAAAVGGPYGGGKGPKRKGHPADRHAGRAFGRRPMPFVAGDDATVEDGEDGQAVAGEGFWTSLPQSFEVVYMSVCCCHQGALRPAHCLWHC